MKYFLCLFSFVLPALLLAQTPFEGTWKTNFADSKLSQKLYEYSMGCTTARVAHRKSTSWRMGRTIP